MEEILKSLAHEICVRNGYPEKYDIILSNDLESEQCIVIKGGETPIIYVNRIWMISLILESEKQKSISAKKAKMMPIKDALAKALQKAPRMTRSLSLMTVRDAIELRKNAKKWSETIVPQLKTHLRDRFFEVKHEIKITITETITNASITRNISNLLLVESTISEAKAALSRSILESEEMKELRDLADREEDSKAAPVNPISITIHADERGISEKMEY